MRAFERAWFAKHASGVAAGEFALSGCGVADLVVYDPEYRGVISVETQMMNTDYSGFEGRAIEGRSSLVTVRGEVAARDGVFVGTFGRGAFLRREPTHF